MSILIFCHHNKNPNNIMGDKDEEAPLTLREILYRDYLRIRNKGRSGIIISLILLIILLNVIEIVG